MSEMNDKRTEALTTFFVFSCFESYNKELTMLHCVFTERSLRERDTTADCIQLMIVSGYGVLNSIDSSDCP